MKVNLSALRSERYTSQHIVSGRRPNQPLEGQMSKRTPPTGSKRSHRPKIAGTQRAALDIVRSPNDSRLRSVEAESTESVPKRDSDSKKEAHLIENAVTALQHEALLVENPATALQDDCKKT